MRCMMSTHDLAVGLRAGERRDDGVDALHAAFAIGECAALFQERRGGQHDVGELRRLGHEHLLHHEELERVERLLHVLGVRVGLHDILAHDPQRLQLARERGVIHLRDFQADLVGQLRAVELLIQPVVGRIVHLEITRALVRLAAHVGRALHVVLAAQRIHAHAGPADVAGHHRDVRR